MVIGGEGLPDERKKEHHYILQELVQLLGQRCQGTSGSRHGVDNEVSARKVFGRSGKRREMFRTSQRW